MSKVGVYVIKISEMIDNRTNESKENARRNR